MTPSTITKLPSGLVVFDMPKAEEKPKRYYKPLEVRGDERREKVSKALDQLWDALGLSSGSSGIRLEHDTWDAHYDAFTYIGRMFLGSDLKEKEIKT